MKIKNEIEVAFKCAKTILNFVIASNLLKALMTIRALIKW